MAFDAPGVAPGSNLKLSVVSRTIEPAIYDKSRFLARIKEHERGYGQLTVRKVTAASGSTIASTDDGTTVAFQGAGLTPVNMTPTWLYAAHQYPDSMKNQGGDEVDGALVGNLEDAIAAYLDYTLLQNLASFTNNVGAAATDVDAAIFRGAVAQLFTTGKMEAEPGEAAIFGILSTAQLDDIMSIPEFTNADQRGGGETPLVSGMVSKGYGVNMHFSTLLYSDAGGAHGGLWTKKAVGYYFNKRIGIEKQRYLKSNRIMVDCEVASNVVYNQLGYGINHKAA